MFAPDSPDAFPDGHEGRDGNQANEMGAAPNLVRSAQLLGEQRAITIEHEGSHYVLRATRNGKLILTK